MLPKTRGELYAFIGILLTIVTILLSQAKKDTNTTIQANQVINHIMQIPAPGVPERARGAKVGRNHPCVCGRGKKYKKCCLGGL